MRFLTIVLGGFLIVAVFSPVEAKCIIHRSTKARHDFQRTHVCPSSGKMGVQKCVGFVIDHKDALACGGKDTPENMQYMTVAAAKEKDKWERKDCPPCAVK